MTAPDLEEAAARPASAPALRRLWRRVALVASVVFAVTACLAVAALRGGRAGGGTVGWQAPSPAGCPAVSCCCHHQLCTRVACPQVETPLGTAEGTVIDPTQPIKVGALEQRL